MREDKVGHVSDSLLGEVNGVLVDKRAVNSFKMLGQRIMDGLFDDGNEVQSLSNLRRLETVAAQDSAVGREGAHDAVQTKVNFAVRFGGKSGDDLGNGERGSICEDLFRKWESVVS